MPQVAGRVFCLACVNSRSRAGDAVANPALRYRRLMIALGGNPGRTAIFPPTRGRNPFRVAGLLQPSTMQDRPRLDRVFAP
jgi:hypothetical protein